MISIVILIRYLFCFYFFQVLECFPESLQIDVCYHLRQDLFNTIPAFKEADQSCLRSLAMKFRTSYCLPEQCVVRQGDPIQEIYFICSGTVQVVRDGKSIFTLSKLILPF
jgi:S-methylmethionine-dependent homocysteine/selenocysteine methylase